MKKYLLFLLSLCVATGIFAASSLEKGAWIFVYDIDSDFSSYAKSFGPTAPFNNANAVYAKLADIQQSGTILLKNKVCTVGSTTTYYLPCVKNYLSSAQEIQSYYGIFNADNDVNFSANFATTFQNAFSGANAFSSVVSGVAFDAEVDNGMDAVTFFSGYKDFLNIIVPWVNGFKNGTAFLTVGVYVSPASFGRVSANNKQVFTDFLGVLSKNPNVFNYILVPLYGDTDDSIADPGKLNDLVGAIQGAGVHYKFLVRIAPSRGETSSNMDAEENSELGAITSLKNSPLYLGDVAYDWDYNAQSEPETPESYVSQNGPAAMKDFNDQP